MGGFDNDYDLTGPVGSDPANELDTIIKDGSKGGTAERFALEHVPLDSAATGANDKNNSNAQGRHIPGMVSVLLADTTANIAQFVTDNQPPTGTGIGLGAIALDTTLGQLQRFDGTAFVNLGLSSTIYAAGEGLLLVADEFAIDPADADDMLAGTSLAKVVTPAMAKWSYGNTEYLNMVTRYTANSPNITEDTWVDVPLQTPEINTIIGSSVDTGADTFTLTAGVYLISMGIGSILTQEQIVSRDVSLVGKLHNLTADTVVTYTPANLQKRAEGDRVSSVFLSERTVEVSISETTTFQMSVWLDKDGGATAFVQANFFLKYGITAAIIADGGVPVHSLQIWKKKPVGA